MPGRIDGLMQFDSLLLRERPFLKKGAEGATTPETLRQKDRTICYL